MNHKRIVSLLAVIFSFLLFLYTLIKFANKSYPLVGHDFQYFVPHLLDSYIHYHVNGLSIQWYTPSFGSGLPAYPNPQHMQFTLPEFLMIFSGPWSAIWVSNVVFIMAGFISSYFLFENVFGLDPLSSAIGTIVFNINGFVFSHAVVGHLGYQAFPLLPLALLALFRQGISPVYRAILLALLCGINIHGGGFYVIVIGFFSLLITVPLLIILHPQVFSWRGFGQTIVLTTVFTVTISGSKLYAISAYMRWFPRQIADHYTRSLFDGLFGIFLQLFGSSTLLPMERLLDNANLTNYIAQTLNAYHENYSLWEFDTSVSPIALLLVGLPLVSYVSAKRKMELKTILLLVISLFGLWLTTEFRLTNGLIYPNIRHLPVIASLHVNLRFAAAYLLPLSLLSALGFNYLQAKIKLNALVLGLFILFVTITLIPLETYSSSSVENYLFSCDISQANIIYRDIKSGKAFYISSNNTKRTFETFQRHVSSLRPYEPIFGYKLENFHPLTKSGRVSVINDNYFNMTNPASLVFPEKNGLFLFERIHVNEQEEFDQFVNYKQPDWKLPVIQNILNILLLCSIIFLPMYVFINLGTQVLKRL